MPDIADLAPHTETVEIRGQLVAVRGLSLRFISRTVAAAPALHKALSGVGITFSDALAAAPDAAIAVLAHGLRWEPDDPRLDDLNLEDSAKIFDAVIKASAPGGFGPLLDRVGGIVGNPDLRQWLADRFSNAARSSTSSPGSTSSSAPDTANLISSPSPLAN